MTKVYYTKDVAKVRGLHPLIEELPSLAAVSKFTGYVKPEALKYQSDVDKEDVVLLAVVKAGRTS